MTSVSSTPPFVGRERELAELQSGFDDAMAGRGRLFLIAGESGIGKTRLADELTSHAARRRARVLWGRCWEGEGAPPFWSWVQVIRAAIRDLEPEALTLQMGSGAAYAAQLVPEIGENLPSRGAQTLSMESENARFFLFDSITCFLKDLARLQPIVLILDDLHAADLPALLLLQFLARELTDARMLIVGTYREAEARRSAERAELLAHLAREGRRILLRGLSENDVAVLIEAIASVAPTSALVKAIHQATEGNALFVDETVRLFLAEGELQTAGPTAMISRLPDGVREAIRRRLGPLPQKSHEVLSVAAVAGREFDFAILEGVCDRPREQILEVLDQALADNVVTEVSRPFARYRFCHGLFRETLYEDVPLARRLHLHGQIGAGLERMFTADLENHLPELAHHFYQSAGAVGIDKAIEYGRRAGHHAATQFAYEEAAGHYERALEALAGKGAAVEDERCRLLVELGGCWRKSGETARARDAFERASAMAMERSDPEVLARAALGYAGRWAEGVDPDGRVIGHLEQALEALGDTDSALLAMVMGRLAAELIWVSREPCLAMGRQAVEMARRLRDTGALCYALNARLMTVFGGPDNSEDTLAMGYEILRLAREAGDDELIVRGHEWLVSASLEAGNLGELDASMGAIERRAQELRQPSVRWSAAVLRAMRALLEGRLEEAEQLAGEALALGQQVGDRNASRFFAAQLFVLRREQGRLDELEEFLRGFVEQDRMILAYRCALVFVYGDLGRGREAKQEFEQLAANDFADLPRIAEWGTDVALLAEVCCFLGDQRRAALLYDLLLPVAARNVVIGFDLAWLGAAAHYLGLLATTLQRWEAAARHFEDALDMHRRVRARPFVARTQYELARMLLAKGAATSDERVAELLEAALATASELGLKELEAKVLAVRRAPAPPPERESTAIAAQAGLRREGDFWTVTFEGRVSRLKDIRGFHYLLHLLRHPGSEFHVSDLIVSVEKVGDRSAVSAALGDAGEMLDAKAKEAYRRRLKDLREEASEAQLMNDLERERRAQHEIDQLGEELARAVGLGGRDRKAASVTERARLRTTKSIKYAISKIAEVDASLGEHLVRSVRTGTFCGYDPDPRSSIRWNL